jgi:hypothetical protein
MPYAADLSHPSSPPRQAGLVDPRALMAIRNLELRARVVVEGFWNGLHRSPYHGFSVEFTEYRPYSPGDDIRYLDWRLYARSDRYYLKRFEDETNLRCHLLVDQSRSMGYGSVGYSKADYARTPSGFSPSTNVSANIFPRAIATATCANSCWRWNGRRPDKIQTWPRRCAGSPSWPENAG